MTDLEIPADTGDGLADACIRSACAHEEYGNAALLRAHAQKQLDVESTEPLVTTREMPDSLATHATTVHVHRDPNPSTGCADWVFCSTDAPIETLPAPAYGSAIEWVESQVYQQFDEDCERLDDLVPTMGEQEARGEEPIQVGTLFYETDRIVALELDAEAFDGVAADQMEGQR